MLPKTAERQPAEVPLHLRNQLRVQAATACQQGKKQSNDDCLGIRIPEEPLLTTKGIVAVIADGVSGAEKGREAAEICVQGLLNDYYDAPDAWKAATAVQKVLTSLNRWLFQLGQNFNESSRGFVTTLSVLVIKGNTGHIFHVGDSRVGRVRDHDWTPLTRDHTARLNEEHRQLTRAMGLDVNLDVDYRQVTVREGDVFALTTDGLHEFVTGEDFEEALAVTGDAFADQAEELAQLALTRGSADNVSALLVRVEALSVISEQEVIRQFSQMPFPPELAPGMLIDGYRVRQEVDSSSRSQVYLVEDEAVGEKVIMKTPSVNFEDDREYLERFAMEAWIAKRVDSPHVVKSKSIPGRQQFLYNLFEYVEGPTLAAWMKQNPKPEVKAVRAIVNQVVTGLRRLHRREMLHQDLKPDNIVLHPERGAVIIDLGSGYVAGIDEIEVDYQRDSMLGTLHYSAPEYRLGRKATAKSDMFSLGVIVYKMFTGHFPYGEGFTKAHNLREFSALKYQPAHAHNPLTPIWIDGLLRKMVQINPERRYDLFSEMLYDFEHPNSEFLLSGSQPLLQRGSLSFWRGAALVLLVAEVLTLVWVLSLS